MSRAGPHDSIGCTLQRTSAYALYIRIERDLAADILPVTIAAVAAQLVLVPCHVVLETGELEGRGIDHVLAIGHLAALVRRAGIQLRVVAPASLSADWLLRVGILPADGLFSSVDTAAAGLV